MRQHRLELGKVLTSQGDDHRDGASSIIDEGGRCLPSAAELGLRVADGGGGGCGGGKDEGELHGCCFEG